MPHHGLQPIRRIYKDHYGNKRNHFFLDLFYPWYWLTSHRTLLVCHLIYVLYVYEYVYLATRCIVLCKSMISNKLLYYRNLVKGYSSYTVVPKRKRVESNIIWAGLSENVPSGHALTSKALIKLCGCAVWLGPSLFLEQLDYMQQSLDITRCIIEEEKPGRYRTFCACLKVLFPVKFLHKRNPFNPYYWGQIHMTNSWYFFPRKWTLIINANRLRDAVSMECQSVLQDKYM